MVEIEAVIRFEYIFSFIVPLICLIILGIILFLPKRKYINNNTQAIGKAKQKYYLKENESIKSFRDPHEITDIETRDLNYDNKQKKYKKFLILVLRIVFIFASVFLLITTILPLSLDIPAVLNHDYQVYEVRLMQNSYGHDINTKNGRPDLITIKVQDIESGKVFDFRTMDVPGVNLYEGDIITITILPCSRIGGYSK